jgi:hypothetical protein
LNYYTTVVGLDTPYQYDYLAHLGDDESSDITVRVPQGHYAIVSTLFQDDDLDDLAEAVLAQPNLSVSADTQLTLDARAAKPVTVSVPDRGAIRSESAVTVGVRNGSNGWVSYGGIVNGHVAVHTAQLGPDGGDNVVSVFRSALSDGSDPSAYAYQLAWYRRGTLPTGFTPTLTAKQLATERTSAGVQAPAGTAYLESAATIPGYPLAPIYTSAPASATRYFKHRRRHQLEPPRPTSGPTTSSTTTASPRRGRRRRTRRARRTLRPGTPRSSPPARPSAAGGPGTSSPCE